jgi:hypothetical protein
MALLMAVSSHSHETHGKLMQAQEERSDIHGDELTYTENGTEESTKLPFDDKERVGNGTVNGQMHTQMTWQKNSFGGKVHGFICQKRIEPAEKKVHGFIWRQFQKNSHRLSLIPVLGAILIKGGRSTVHCPSAFADSCAIRDARCKLSNSRALLLTP